VKIGGECYWKDDRVGRWKHCAECGKKLYRACTRHWGGDVTCAECVDKRPGSYEPALSGDNGETGPGIGGGHSHSDGGWSSGCDSHNSY